MNWRNYKTLIVGGGICLLLLLVGVFLLFSFSGKHAATQSDVDSGISRLKSLKGAPVFPASENVQVLKDNIKQLSAFRAEYISNVSSGQIDPEAMSGTDFLQFYEAVRGGLVTDGSEVNAEAGKTAVKFPEYFGFGFEAYMKGGRPSEDSVPRLTVQLKTIDALCRLLFDAGVTEINQIARDAFEMKSEEDNRSAGNQRNKATDSDENTLFEEENYTFVVKGTESNVVNIVDSFASCDLPIVVKKMSVKNGNANLQPKFARQDVEGEEGMSKAPTRRSSRRRAAPAKKAVKAAAEEGERTIAAGNEDVEAIFELTVYRFNTETSAATGGR